MCRPFLSLLPASQVYTTCVPCPGEQMDHSHALWTSLLASCSGATVDDNGTSPCLELSKTSPLPVSGKIQFQTSFLTHFEDGYGVTAPTQRRPASGFLAVPKGVHFFLSIFFQSSLFSPNLCLPTFPLSCVGLLPHTRSDN